MDDLTLLEKALALVTGLVGAAAGMVTGAYIAGREKSSVMARLAALENERECARPFCVKQREDILETLRSEISDMIEAALVKLTVGHNKELAAIDKSLALISQSIHRSQTDVEEIFRRLNERDPASLGTGNRRRRDQARVALDGPSYLESIDD